MKFIYIFLIIIPNLTYAESISNTGRFARCINTWPYMSKFQKNRCTQIPNFYITVKTLDKNLEKKIELCIRAWWQLSYKSKLNCQQLNETRNKLDPIKK